jgi:hypothetical protein
MYNEKPTSIFNIVHQCPCSFDRVVERQDEALLMKLLVPRDGVTSRIKQAHTAFNFLGVLNKFLFWVDDTKALSLMESSLDGRLRGLADISAMVSI